jgi:uncharacterized protein
MGSNWRELISQPKYGIKTEKNIMVPTRDGTKLAVDIFRPDVEGKFPGLLAMSPYGKEEQEYLLGPQPLNKSAVWDGNIEAGDTSEIVARGYIHVVADVRGTGYSEGEYFGGYTTLEARDGADLVEWIARQPWCDGNVALVGYSYYSKIALKVAIEQPPHLKCLFVSHVAGDHYRESGYSGGVLSLFQYGIWDGRHGTSGIARKNAVSEMEKNLSEKELERLRQEILQDPDIRYYPNMYHLIHYPYKNPRFFDILVNPYDGPFWWERSAYQDYDKIQVPVHVIGKVAHEGGGYWDVYAGLNTPKKLFVKPNAPEERPWREDFELMIRWYDHWLKGNDTGLMNEPPVKIYMQGANKFRLEKEWPLPETEHTKVFLRRWESLSFEPELYQPDPDCFLQQPLYLSTKRDSVKYLSPPLPSDMEVLGPAALNLYASIDTDDTNWIAKLYDLAPGGSQTRLGKGYLKATHRALDPQKSTSARPFHPHTRESLQAVKPGEIYEYNIELGILTGVFKAGHRIKLEIESMESPRDPEMQIHYHPHLPSSRTTLHKIYRNRECQSHFLLPIVSGKDSVQEVMSDENFQGGA